MATGPFRASVTLALALVVAATALTAQAADVGPPPVLVKSYGPGFELPDRPSRLGDMASGDEITEYDLSYGCIVGGVAGTGLSVGAGGLNVINLIAGGIVPAATPVAAYLALGGVVFASFCAVGQALTPAALAAYGYFAPPPSRVQAPQMDARFCAVSTSLTACRAAPGSR